MADIALGYYVHHHGTGHMQRAIQICKHIQQPVVLFSSAPPTEPLPPHVTYVELPSDMVDNYIQPNNSSFHYTPWSDTIFERYQIILQKIRERAITGMYVDVSVEVAQFAKILGLRVGYAVMQGVRLDAVHTSCYNSVDFLLSHNSQRFDKPSSRNTNTPIFYSGGISRFKKIHPVTPTAVHNIVIVISPKSTVGIQRITEAARANPHVQWHILGVQSDDIYPDNVAVHGVVSDPSQYFEDADVIVGAGGNNTIMEAASYGKPFVCIPEARPYDEQKEAALTLKTMHTAIYSEQWPKPAEWASLFERVLQCDLRAFSNLVDDNSAAHAAAIIQQQLSVE